MSQRSLAHVLIFAVALLIGAGPYLVRAAGLRAEQEVVANVDMQRLFMESEARRTAEKNIREYGHLMYQRYEEIARLPYLTPAEIEEYSLAINSPNPTEAQKQRIAALKGESAKRSEEAQQLALRRDSEITDKDRARLRELSAMQQQREQTMELLKKLYQQMVNDEEARQSRAAREEIRAVVGKVAKAMGIAQVFDSSVLLYAAIDLTPNVLPKVKAKN
jgi:Skp family chaperone for outer membrane proteins